MPRGLAIAGYLAVVVVAVIQAVVLGEPARTLGAALPFLVGAVTVAVVARCTVDDRRGRLVLHAIAVAGVALAVLTVGTFLGACPPASGSGRASTS